MPDDHKAFLKTVREYISQNPDVLPDVMRALTDGMDTWKKRVLLHQDSKANLAITMLSAFPAIDKMNLQNQAHRSTLRVTAFALKLHLRDPMTFSAFENDLAELVKKADQIDGKHAEDHYRILGY